MIFLWGYYHTSQFGLWISCPSLCTPEDCVLVCVFTPAFTLQIISLGICAYTSVHALHGSYPLFTMSWLDTAVVFFWWSVTPLSRWWEQHKDSGGAVNVSMSVRSDTEYPRAWHMEAIHLDPAYKTSPSHRNKNNTFSYTEREITYMYKQGFRFTDTRKMYRCSSTLRCIHKEKL